MAPYVPPSAPTELVVSNGIKLAVAEAKFANPIEVSDLQPIDHGPGRFMLCVRGVSNDSRTGIYAVFFNQEAYAGLRLPAVLEGCEHQNYHPFVPIAAPQKPAPAKPHGKGADLSPRPWTFERNVRFGHLVLASPRYHES